MTTSDKSKTLVQSSIQTHGQVRKKSYFDFWHFWKSYCWLRLIWGLDHRSRSRSRSRRSRSRRIRYILPGAGVGAGAGMLPRSRSRSRSRPKMSRLRIPAGRNFSLAISKNNTLMYLYTKYKISNMFCDTPLVLRRCFSSTERLTYLMTFHIWRR